MMTDYVIETKSNKSRVPTVLMLVAALGLAPLAGCQTIERETGINLHAQRGAAAGGAFGGIVAAIAGANPAWIAASVVLGGVTGGVIGDRLGKRDAERHARTNVRALDRLAEGQTDSWRNERTGNYGSTTVTRVTHNGDGVVCKGYREQVHTSAESVTKEATACKGPDGSWKS